MDASVLERLKAREEKRLEAVSRRHVDLKDGSNESTDAFNREFARQRGIVEAAVQQFLRTSGDARCGAESQALFAQVAAIEDMVTSAAYYLPPYDLRQATLAVASIKESLHSATAAKQPRKKFSFSAKRDTNSTATVGTTQSVGTSRPFQDEATLNTTPLTAPAGHTITNKSHETLVLRPGDLDDMSEVTLSDLKGCTVYVLDPVGAIFLHRLQQCTVVTGPIAGSLLAEGELCITFLKKVLRVTRRIKKANKKHCFSLVI